MYITTLKLSSATDKIETIDGQTIKITSQKPQEVLLSETKIGSRFFINPKHGFTNSIILLELNPNGLWYVYNNKLERKRHDKVFSEAHIDYYLKNGDWLEIKY